MAAARQGQDVTGGGGNTAHLDVVEGGVQWLAACVEAEKREKEWLASKYDDKCAEAAALKQELARLQAELTDVRRSAGGSPLLPKEHEKDSPGSASPSGGGGLMGRRGLSLSTINTPQQRSRMKSGVANQVEKISPVLEQRALVVAPDEYDMEPTSALLKRRKDASQEWEANGMVTKVASIREHKEIDKEIKNLRVDPQKVFSMVGDGFGDCPASPKRVSKAMTERRPTVTLGGGSGGTA